MYALFMIKQLNGECCCLSLDEPASARALDTELRQPENARAMKFDRRANAYCGEVQRMTARLYQGQTSNLRTPAGGFAPVYSTVDASGGTRHPAGAVCQECVLP